MVDLFRRALLQPVFGTVQAVGELCVGIGHIDLAEYGFQHGNIEIHDGAELYKQSHGNGFHRSARNLAVIHDCLCCRVCFSGAAIIQHLIKLEVLTQNTVVKTEIKRLGGLGFGVQPQNDFGLIQAKQGIRRQIQT